MERERPKLSLHEAQMFAHYDILAPPFTRLPAGFELSYAGVPVAALAQQRVGEADRGAPPPAAEAEEGNETVLAHERILVKGV